MDEIDWDHRLIGIKGTRGVGKTTFLLDYLRTHFLGDRSCLYLNLNHFIFTHRRIVSIADEFYKKGGKLLVLDQVHKFPEWSHELRECYDNFPDLKIIFTTSPVLRIIEGHKEIKDIVKIYHLVGLSFREYLNYRTESRFPTFSFEEILKNHLEISKEITENVRPLAYLADYLVEGYFPYFRSNSHFYTETLLKNVNLALEIDVTYLNQIELKYLPKIRKLLHSIAREVPFSPNVSKLSLEIETSRATVMNYLRYLKNARLINLLYREDDKEQMKKPEMVYLQNTNLLYAIAPENVENSTLRKTFFYSQVNYRNDVHASSVGDFKVNGEYDFIVGGKYTSPSNNKCYAAADMIEVGERRVIPLWLFGFLY